MSATRLLHAAAAAVTLLLAVPPASAQPPGQEHKHQEQAQPRHQQQPPEHRPQPQRQHQSPPPQQQHQPPPQQQRQHQPPPQQAQPRHQSPPQDQPRPHAQARPQPQQRPETRPAPTVREGHAVQRPAPTTGLRGGEWRGERRGEDFRRGRAPLAAPSLRVYREPRGYGYARPRVAVPVIRYRRPYFVFRPHYFMGFGLYLGYPVPYPVTFGYPAYVYGNGSVLASAPAYGGISLAISPDDASVIVDGVFVGTAADFSPENQPLTLVPGRHHIELQAEDLVPLAFDVDVQEGEVLPFNGTLEPAY